MAKTAAELRREKLIARQRDAVKTRNDKSTGKKLLLDWSKYRGEKPEQFVPEAKKKHLIDLIPWKITQDWYKDLLTPAGKPINSDIDDLDYKLELSVHKYIGEDNESFVCLRESFGKKCPICDEMFAEYNKENTDKDRAKSLNTSWRDYYNVYDYDDETFKVWEDVSWHNYEQEFMEESEDGEEIIIFSDYEFGKSIEFKGKEDSIGNNKFVIPKNINFCDRDPYTEEEIADAVSLDSLLIIATAEEMKKALSDEESEEENIPEPKKEEPKPRSRGRQRQVKKEEPAPKTDPDNPCPFNRTFGDDCDPNADDCNNCPDESFEECMKKKEQIDLDEELKNKTDPENKDLNEMQIDEKREKEPDNGPTRRRARSAKEEPKKEEPSTRPTRRRTRR